MPNSLKIALVGPYPREEGKIHGGVEAVLTYLADGLAARQGVEVHVVTAVSGLAAPTVSTNAAGVHTHRVPKHDRFGAMTGFAADRAQIGAALKQISPDIVNVHTQTMYPHAALERGYPSVLTIHGVYFREVRLLKGLSGRLRALPGCYYERLAIKRARHIVICSDYLAQVYGKLLDRAKVRKIDNAIDADFFAVPDREEPDAVLFLGVIIERKGVIHLMQAAAKLRARGTKFRLWVVGPVGDPAYFQQVTQVIDDNGLADCVEITGMVSQEEVLARYARCAVVVLPSFEETAPMVIAQAQAAGRPLVASNSAGIPFMVTEGETGFLVPFGDADALADRIGRLLSDDETRHRMGCRAKEIAETRFKWSIVVDKYLEVFEDVLADSSRIGGG